MSKKTKKIIICVATFLLLALIATSLVLDHRQKLAAEEAERLRIYHETYVVMDGAEYLRTSTELDLSNQQITEVEKLQELTKLQRLNLRGTGITIEQYDLLAAALPDCEILWSVPFQGAYCDNTAQELVVETLSADDIPVFAYLPELVSVKAESCRDYEELFLLMEQHPDLAIACSVPVGDLIVDYTEESITVTNPDADELLAKLKYLPNLTSVTLEGTLPEKDFLILLKETYPEIRFLWNFTVCGVETNSLAEFIDLSKIQMTDTKELEAALPCFYNLAKVDMIDCGLSNEDMDALNKRHPETLFVWKVKVSSVYLRTDAKYFMPWKHKISNLNNLYNLRYCTEMEVLDFGHKGVYDVSYIEYMPKLRFLLLLECTPDLEIVGNCTTLEYIELCSSPLTDFWPLTNLTNLKDLNLSYTPFLGNHRFGKFGDLTPLMQMTWLDRLWMAYSRIGDENRAMMREALPATELLFISDSATDRGWRNSPQYYEQRDILEMWYMVQ